MDASVTRPANPDPRHAGEDADDIKTVLRELGWSQAALGRRTGHAPNTVSRWILGRLDEPVWLREYLSCMLTLHRLSTVLGEDVVSKAKQKATEGPRQKVIAALAAAKEPVDAIHIAKASGVTTMQAMHTLLKLVAQGLATTPDEMDSDGAVMSAKFTFVPEKSA